MNISLTPALERYIQEKMDSGYYTSVSEVIRESLRLMHTYENIKNNQIELLNQSIDLGMVQLNAGDKISASEAYRKLKKKLIEQNKDE